MDIKQKSLHWMGSSKKDLKALPAEVQDTFGHALNMAQDGIKFDGVKPLRGFGGASVLEVIEDFNSDT